MKITVLFCFHSPVFFIDQILCQFQAYKGAGGATKKQLLQILAYNQEKIYFSIVADFFEQTLCYWYHFQVENAKFWQNHIIP